MSAAGGRSSGLRRYPALGYLAATGALALLLPSGLTLPHSGPPTLAEYAPVPGQGEGRGDTAELGLPGTGGLGAGGAGGAGREAPTAERPDTPADPGQLIRRPGTKRCVGNPPRQTEDPLSPPCNAYFEGDNGGATAKGVTRDTVTVVMGADGSTTTDPRAGAVVDCAEAPAVEDNSHDLVCKAFMRYFNDRFQTYGRLVRLYSTHSLTDEEIEERLGPFARIGAGSSKFGTLAVNFAGLRRVDYRESAPYIIGFRPDLEDAARIASTLVCAKLAGRPARYSGTPADQARTRVFGLVMRPSAYRDILVATLRATCGVTMAGVVDNPGSDTTAAARLQSAGVTTVVITADNNGDATVMTRQATAVGWLPEWFVPGEPGFRGLDTTTAGRNAEQTQWQRAFGLTFDLRRGALTEQHWYRAYREGCPDCAEPRTSQFTTASAQYDMLRLLFYGIQSAGPRLTVERIDRGLHAIPPSGSPAPDKPAAYFSPGNYTFLKDATLIAWDPTGQAPGATQTGCYRLPEDGRRRRAGEWPAGDEALFRTGPCQGDFRP